MGGVSGNFVGASGGLLMSCIAFSIVFLVILGLMLVMMALKYIVRVINPDRPAEASIPVPVAAVRPVAPAPSQAVPVQTAGEQMDEGELVAILTAAATAAIGRETVVTGFSPARQSPAASGQPFASQDAASRRLTPAWRMAGILNNSRGLR
jgi:hypothetical protein